MKELMSKMSEMFDEYKKAVIIQKHGIHKILDESQRKLEFEKYRKYVDYINDCLDSLKLEQKELLIEVYINHKKYDELHYSQAAYYRKLKKAIERFISISGA